MNLQRWRTEQLRGTARFITSPALVAQEACTNMSGEGMIVIPGMAVTSNSRPV
jgi:hypothetical protein